MSFVKKILFLRPFNQEETKGHSQSCLRIDTDAKRSSITVLGPTGQSSVFDFYNCYWSANDHSSLSEDIRQYAFQNVNRKFSTCVLLYGPMNTGKSYVLLGGPEHEGLLLTTLREVFTALPKQRVMLLVYEIDDETEQIFDLIQGELAASFHDVVQKRVGSFNQAIATLEDALSRRHASTHTFFTIKLSDKKTGQIVVMDFVLLENECKEKDYPSPRPSFCALHELIHSMGGKTEPDFSKCKLTEHFQEHFQNGRYRMIMLATVGPSAKDYDQIMRVLTYCTSATVPKFASSGLLTAPETNTKLDLSAGRGLAGVDASRVAVEKSSFPPTPIRSSTHILAPPPYLSTQQQQQQQEAQISIPLTPILTNTISSSTAHAPPPPAAAAAISHTVPSTPLLTPSTPSTPFSSSAAHSGSGTESPLLTNGPGSPNSREFDALYRCVHKLTQLLEDYDRGVISSGNGHRSGIRSMFPSLTNTIQERIQALEDCIMLADQCRMRTSNVENNSSNSSNFLPPLPSPVPSSHALLPSAPFENMNHSKEREHRVFSTLSRLGEADAKSPVLTSASSASAPLSSSSAASPATLSTDKKPLGVTKTKANIFDVLLVEDVPVSSKLGLQQLRRANYKPMSCENGSEAIIKFTTHWETLKFVLMDINMPELNGIQATELIRKWEVENRSDGERVIIFGLTGNVDGKSLRTYRDSGMNGCIVKGSNLVEAMKKATQQLDENPDQFVNLCNVELQESDDSPNLQPQPAPSSSTASGNSSNGSANGGPELDDLPNLRKTMHMRRMSKTSLDGEALLAEARASDPSVPPTAVPQLEPGEGGACPQIGTPNTNLSFRRLMAKKFVSKFGGNDDELDLGEDSSSKRGSPTSGTSKTKGLKKRKPFSLDDIPDVEGGTDLPPIPLSSENKDILTPTHATALLLLKKENENNNNNNNPPPPPKTVSINGDTAAATTVITTKDKESIDIPRPTSPTPVNKSLLKPISLPEFAISPASAVPPNSPPVTPTAASSTTSSSSPTQSTPRAGLNMKSAANKKPNLLLVEDVKVSQKIGQAALTRANFKVAVAQNGEEAVDMFKKHHESLEVILMDVLMPGMNGIEATYIIRQFEQENSLEPTTVLGLTGNVDQANLLEYERCGMNGCIVKGKHLEQAVNKVLSQLNESPGFVSYIS